MVKKCGRCSSLASCLVLITNNNALRTVRRNPPTHPSFHPCFTYICVNFYIPVQILASLPPALPITLSLYIYCTVCSSLPLFPQPNSSISPSIHTNVLFFHLFIHPNASLHPCTYICLPPTNLLPPYLYIYV